MARMLHDQRVFWRQFLKQYHTTGAILPSSRFLARALARYVGQKPGQKILEVGPGTGAVTGQIVRRMPTDATLDLVELNDEFVRRLNERFAAEEPFCLLGDRARILHGRIEELPGEAQYDLIVSGLPLNNFAVADVERILEAFRKLLRPGGILSFFEYVGIRSARAILSGPAQRARLRGIAAALDELLGPHEIQRDCVWPNLPPAWVHHVLRPDSSNC